MNDSKENLTSNLFDNGTSFFSFPTDNSFEMTDSKIKTKNCESTPMNRCKSSKELILDLSCSIKNRVINNLINHSELLYGKRSSEEEQINLIKENNCLVQQLMNLQIRPDLFERVCSKRIKIDNAESNPDGKSDENNYVKDVKKENSDSQMIKFDTNLIFEISWHNRIKMIDLLVCNHNYSIKYIDSLSSEIKNGLINENNKFIGILLNLKPRICFDEIRSKKSADETEQSDIDIVLENIEYKLEEIACENSEHKENLEKILKRINEQKANQAQVIPDLEKTFKKVIEEEFSKNLKDRAQYINCIQSTTNKVKESKDSTCISSLVADILTYTCSFSFTGRTCVLQDSYHCFTCDLVGNRGICLSCVNVCHRDHHVEIKPACKNYCDCNRFNKCGSLVKLPSRK